MHLGRGCGLILGPKILMNLYLSVGHLGVVPREECISALRRDPVSPVLSGNRNPGSAAWIANFRMGGSSGVGVTSCCATPSHANMSLKKQASLLPARHTRTKQADDRNPCAMMWLENRYRPETKYLLGANGQAGGHDHNTTHGAWPILAPWRDGHAAVSKTAVLGSIPGGAVPC